MKVLKAKRAILKGAFTRICSFALGIKAETSIEECESRLEKLSEVWNEYHVLLNLMIEKIDEEDGTQLEEIEKQLTDFEDRYHNVVSIIKKHVAKSKFKSNLSTSNTTSTSIPEASIATVNSSIGHLPKIHIKPFSGDFTEWKPFHDLFVSSVDTDSTLSACQKFHFLKSFLVEEPANLLKHIAITDENYSEAWAKLKARYDKSGIIAGALVRKFMNISSISNPSAVTLRRFTDCADEVVRGLRALGSQAEQRDVWLISFLLNKLDPETCQNWAKYEKKNDDFPTFSEFLSFLERSCSILETSHHTDKTRSQISRQLSVKVHQVSLLNSCHKCKGDHELSRCDQFLSMNSSARREFVNKSILCFNCLRSGHRVSTCRSKFSCRTCHRKHHTLLHTSPTQSSSPETSPSVSVPIINPSDQYTNSMPSTSQQALNPTSSIVTHFSQGDASTSISTLLPTALGKVRDCFGNYQICRILLDCGSQVSFISEACIQRLGLKRRHARIQVNSVSQAGIGNTRGCVNLHVKSVVNDKSIDLNAYILPTVTCHLPTQSFIFDAYTYLNLELADPNFFVSSEIDILLGMDKVFNIFEGSKLPGKVGYPDAILTIFGWVIGGDISSISLIDPLNSVISTCHSNLETDKTLTRFWELEEVPTTNALSNEEQQAEEHFTANCARAPDGKFCVALPFKVPPPIEFGKSIESAMKRLIQTENRFRSNPSLKEKYCEFMNDYFELGHMEKVPLAEVAKPTSECYYLPHHPVFKDSSTTTSLRVVFDASSKTGSFPSLNDTLLIGPPIQRDLFSVLLRFRCHRYAISGDIEKMFRQIWVKENHCDYQRILWRNPDSNEITHYRLKTVTYGTSCAPYLSVKTLEELGKHCSEEHPLASKVILNDFYVDDVMTGADSIEELYTLHKDLVSTLHSAGFNLRKWSSNCFPFLLSLPEDMREMTPVDFQSSKTVKVLGLRWKPLYDSFVFSVSFHQPSKVTRRVILSEGSKIFDPLGFLTPATVMIKMLFQELWPLKLHWDDEVPEEVAIRWLKIRSDFPSIEALQIPRSIQLRSGATQFHGFCDASKSAYAAVIYCRIVTDGQITTHFLVAKSRVSPIEPVTIPRLELCAAVLLSRLMKSVIGILGIELSQKIQLEMFSTEISTLQANLDLPVKSKLLSLRPFIDKNGLLRVGGRIENSSAAFSVKHPIILSQKHIVSEMIVQYFHLHHLHVGVTELIYLVRKEFWIIGIRNLAKRIVHKCVACFKQRKMTSNQIMSSLPLERVTQSRPFSRVGCDYAGPFNLKLNHGRNPKRVKAYVSLFVCFITKAIHIELVGDLTTQAFIGALDRFIARRGKPIEIWSDNGTNFHGAQRYLDHMLLLLRSQKFNECISDHLTFEGISWRFIPPASPHFGGLWEAGVKSVKTHLRRVIGDHSLTYEEFYTLLTRIEALLNSRPLCASNDSEIDALTPSHFLIGQAYTSRPEPVTEDKDITYLQRWEKVKHMCQGFWKRWHSEYLTSLQQRGKWRSASPNVKINQIVVLREPNISQSKWILGKIIKLHPGHDNKVRVVTIQTAKGVYKRPIVKISPLPDSGRCSSSSEGENVDD